MLKTHIRWLIRADMNKVLEIEKQSYASPYNEEDFLKDLRERSTIGMAAEINEQVIAYMIYEMKKNRFNLKKLAVHPDYRRQDVGSQMVNKLVNKLDPYCRNRVIIDIEERNVTAQLFLSSLGFKAIRVLWNHFDDQDAYKMVFTAKETELMECSGR